MNPKLTAVPLGRFTLLPGAFRDRFELNRRYLMSLRNESMLFCHYLEARLTQALLRNTTHGRPDAGDDLHWGWESPTSQIRGQFVGHWLSAAARLYAITGDAEVKARADKMVAELARCQESNGGEWVGAIPETYFHWLAQGRPTWAPQYVLHKIMMGLFEMYRSAGSEQALAVLERSANWFYRWSAQFSREQMDDILDTETGGMLELWADLYGATGNERYLELMRRYDRPRLFEPLLAGEDPLTNRHANTTIPEAHGAARAYEVTGNERWRRVAEAYWKCAVTDRGAFCTGGQTSGEIWTPPFEQAARLGDKNQEHCVVYNMIRLADYLLRWTGEALYADYIERNLYNGILAQQHPQAGMVSYFLPLEPGAHKIWGHPTHDFWCCHGTLVQAHMLYQSLVCYEHADGLAVHQYLPSELRWQRGGAEVKLTQTRETEAAGGGARRRPDRWVVRLAVECDQPVEFALKLRLPEWLAGPASVSVNGEKQQAAGGSGFHAIERVWHRDTVRLELPKALRTCPLPDEPDTVAFLDGPVVLAGLCDEARALIGDKDRPSTLLAPDNEREWDTWLPGYRAVNQQRGLRFRPLHEVTDERYTVYFSVRHR
ncbi:MAG: beta-L-arabinofuranosidase domain-containing protein [Armatimonadota bacterium]